MTDSRSPDEFFVGYEPRMPPGLGRFVRPVVGLVVVAALGAGALFTASQQPPSNGAFEFGVVRGFEGWIEVEPYPTLLVERPGDGLSRWLLVAVGKHGADEQVAGFSGERVRLEGTLIHRDGQTMVEVVDGSIRRADGERAPDEPREVVADSRSFVGEIVDSKCFLGVMKPGSTKPHRACATRCISGGVPPVLLVRDDRGGATYLLLVDQDGGPAGRAIVERDLVAEPVRVTGAVERAGNRLLVRTDPATIERLD